MVVDRWRTHRIFMSFVSSVGHASYLCTNYSISPSFDHNALHQSNENPVEYRSNLDKEKRKNYAHPVCNILFLVSFFLIDRNQFYTRSLSLRLSVRVIHVALHDNLEACISWIATGSLKRKKKLNSYYRFKKYDKMFFFVFFFCSVLKPDIYF